MHCRFCTEFELSSGGNFIYINFTNNHKGTEIFTPQKQIKKLCLKFDNAKPVHCLSNQRAPCSKLLLGVERRITKTANVSLILGDGWTDPWPKGGSWKHTSGIKKYILEVHEVIKTGQMLVVHKKSLDPPIKEEIDLPNEMAHRRINVVLPKTQTLYCTMLEVHDNAGNVRFARRFILFDNESTIKTRKENPLVISSASKITGYKWQIFHELVCVNWRNRYYNSYHVDTNFLASIQNDADNDITGVYDQETGKLPVKGTKNVDGVTGFIYSYSLNNGPYTSEKYMSDFEKESICFNFSLSDGDTYTFRITAEDVMENRLAENVTVHIDRTVPDISNMWLVRNNNKELYVHHSVDLSHMVLQFEAMDPHSGIYSMEWFLGTQVNTSDVGYGAEPIIKVSVNVSHVLVHSILY